MSEISIAVFSYCIISLLSFFVLCNTLASRKNGRESMRITPGMALFLAVIWPIGLVAAYMAFMRNR